MAKIHIKRNHALGTVDAKGKVDVLAQHLHEELQTDYRWSGDTLHFKRSGASGTIGVGADYVVVDVSLGMAYGLLKGKIEATIQENLDQAFS